MVKQHGLVIPINVAYQHPYYLGSGAAAIIRSEGDYYYHSCHSLDLLIEELTHLALTVRGDHPKHNHDYYLSVIRAYRGIDVDKARPQFEDAVSRLKTLGPKRVDLDNLLKEPPQSHLKR